MDPQLSIDTLTTRSASLRSDAAGLSAQADAIDSSLVLLTKGYQSDQAANAQAIQEGIAAGVKDAVDAAVQAATDPLNAQIANISVALNNSADDSSAIAAALDIINNVQPSDASPDTPDAPVESNTEAPTP